MTPTRFSLAVITLLFASLISVSSTLKAQTEAVWLGGPGDWTEARKWSTKPKYPNNDGIQSYSAVIDSGDVTLNQAITIEQFMFGPAGVPVLRGAKALKVRSWLGLNQGLLTGQGRINALGTATISGNSNLHGWALNLSGPTTWSGRLGVGNASVISNLPGATIDLVAGASCASYTPDMGNPNRFKRTLDNHGTINAQGGTPLDITLNNLGTINVNSGPLVLSGGGTNSGPINLANGTTLEFTDSNAPTGINFVFSQASSISGLGSVKFNVFSDADIRGFYNITGTTTVGGGTVRFLSPITNLGSSLVVNGQFTNCDLGSNAVTVSNLNLKKGTITGSGIVTVNGPLEWNEGSMRGAGVTNAQHGVFFNGLTGSAGFNTLDRTLNCYGSSSVQTTTSSFCNLNFGLNAALNIMPGATFYGSRFMISGSSTFGQTNGTITNYGNLVIDTPGTAMFASGTFFVNQGNIQVTNSSLDVRSGTNPSAYIQNAGSVQLHHSSFNINTTSTINGGSLSGNGSIGDIVSNGLIAPFGGSLNLFQSTLTLQSNSVLAYYLSGTQSGVSFGYFSNVSTATLGGALEIELSEPFQSQIQSSDIFTVLSAHSITGQFTNVVSGGRLTTTDGSGSFVVTYSGNQLVLSDFRAN